MLCELAKRAFAATKKVAFKYEMSRWYEHLFKES